jgi:hypothetical protein
MLADLRERRKVWRSRKSEGKYSTSVRGRFFRFLKVEWKVSKISWNCVPAYLSVTLSTLITQCWKAAVKSSLRSCALKMGARCSFEMLSGYLHGVICQKT